MWSGVRESRPRYTGHRVYRYQSLGGNLVVPIYTNVYYLWLRMHQYQCNVPPYLAKGAIPKITQHPYGIIVEWMPNVDYINRSLMSFEVNPMCRSNMTNYRRLCVGWQRLRAVSQDFLSIWQGGYYGRDGVQRWRRPKILVLPRNGTLSGNNSTTIIIVDGILEEAL